MGLASTSFRIAWNEIRVLEIEHTCSEICKVVWSAVGLLLVGSRVLPRGAFSYATYCLIWQFARGGPRQIEGLTELSRF